MQGRSAGPALAFLPLLSVLTGVIYPLAVTVPAQILAKEASGSLILSEPCRARAASSSEPATTGALEAFGEPVVNVLEVNLALDAEVGRKN